MNYSSLLARCYSKTDVWSLIFLNFSLTAGQSLGAMKQQPSDFLSFLIQSKVLLILLASGHLLARLIILMFMRAASSNAIIRFPNRLSWLHQTYQRIESHVSNLAVLFVFLGLFDFILLTMLTNSIKVGQSDEIKTLLIN